MMQIIVFYTKFMKKKHINWALKTFLLYSTVMLPLTLYSRVSSVIHKRQIARDTEHRKSSVIWEILLRPIVKTYWIKLSWRQLHRVRAI